MRLQTIFVSHHLTVKLVHQFVHSRVQIRVGTLGKEVDALDPYIAFGFLPAFFLFLILHSQQNLDIQYLVKMPLDSIKLRCDVGAKGWGYFQMVTTDRQVHKSLLKLSGEMAVRPTLTTGKHLFSRLKSLCLRWPLIAINFDDAVQHSQDLGLGSCVKHPEKCHNRRG
jgi:hypothetical protein